MNELRVYLSFGLIGLLLLSAKTSLLDGSITAKVTVANSGTRAADKVVQLYLHQRFGSASRPARKLKGFRRLTLLPGQKQEISLAISREERNYWSTAKNAWVVEPSDLDVWPGNSSIAALHDTFSVAHLHEGNFAVMGRFPCVCTAAASIVIHLSLER